MPLSLSYLKQYLLGSEAGQGDTTTFQHEAVKHLTSLYNFALGLAKNEDDAADLVQETYLRALRFHDRFQPGTNLRAWLFKILRNAFIDSYWRRSREPAIPAIEDAEGEQGSATLAGVEAARGIETEPLNRLVRIDLREALERLPDQFRTAIVLSDVEGLKVEEIAEIMDCPTNTVKTRLFRGRQMLRKTLREYEN